MSIHNSKFQNLNKFSIRGIGHQNPSIISEDRRELIERLLKGFFI